MRLVAVAAHSEAITELMVGLSICEYL